MFPDKGVPKKCYWYSKFYITLTDANKNFWSKMLEDLNFTYHYSSKSL